MEAVPGDVPGDLLVEAVDQGDGKRPWDVAARDSRVQLQGQPLEQGVQEHQQRQHLGESTRGEGRGNAELCKTAFVLSGI